MLAWDVEDPMPNPGQLSSPLRYIPIDFLQIPIRARSIKEAIHAISMSEQICTLIEAQSHCVKNQKFLIAAVIEHVFTQVVPLPKPRDVKGRVVSADGSQKSQNKCIWSEYVVYLSLSLSLSPSLSLSLSHTHTHTLEHIPHSNTGQ